MIEELYRLAFDAVRNHLRAAGVVFSEDDGDLLFSGHRLGISIAFEGFERQEGKLLAPLDVQIHLDGCEGDRFRVGTLGIGANREAALAAGIHEWHVLAAAPVLAALGAANSAFPNDSPSKKFGCWEVFPGRIGIRGQIPPSLKPQGKFFGTLLAALERHIAAWPLPNSLEFRSIFVMANSVDGQYEVQAAVSGFVDAPLVQRLTTLNWPTSAEAYLYKQLFVLRAGR